jgi:hypothetical protein
MFGSAIKASRSGQGRASKNDPVDHFSEGASLHGEAAVVIFGVHHKSPLQAGSFAKKAHWAFS